MNTILDLDPTTKASVLHEALPYVQRFKDSIFVIKYGGAFMDSTDTSKGKKIASDIAFLHAVGIKVVVVHGGGKAITESLKEKKIKSEFKNGLRVTTKKTISIVDKVLNKKVNPKICEDIIAQGANATAIDGKDLLICEQKVARSIGNSLLVKTSFYGSDPNWSRVTAGYAIDFDRLDFYYDEVPVLLKGVPQETNEIIWKEINSIKT